MHSLSWQNNPSGTYINTQLFLISHFSLTHLYLTSITNADTTFITKAHTYLFLKSQTSLTHLSLNQHSYIACFKMVLAIPYPSPLPCTQKSDRIATGKTSCKPQAGRSEPGEKGWPSTSTPPKCLTYNTRLHRESESGQDHGHDIPMRILQRAEIGHGAAGQESRCWRAVVQPMRPTLPNPDQL